MHKNYSEWPIFQSVRSAMWCLMPALLIGATAVAVDNVGRTYFGLHETQTVYKMLHGIESVTLLAIPIYVFILVTYFYGEKLAFIRKCDIPPIFFVLSNLSMAFLIGAGETALIPKLEPAFSSVFLAIVLSAIGVKCYIGLYALKKRLSKWENPFLNPFVQDAYDAILPIAVLMAFVLVIKVLFLSGMDTVRIDLWRQFDWLYNGKHSLITLPLSVQFLWFVGLHGGRIVMDHYGGALDMLNMSKKMIDTFVYLGGSGATLGLVLAFFRHRNEGKTARIYWMGLLQSIFNINELLLFGIPVILNLNYLLPFIFVPIALTLTTYFFVAIGAIQVVNENISWVTPIFFSGYYLTESVWGVVLQGANLWISYSVYGYFVKREVVNNNKRLAEKVDVVETWLKTDKRKVDQYEYSAIYRTLVYLKSDLEHALKNRTGAVYFLYQPKVKSGVGVVGVEALVRWLHPKAGPISPMLVMEIVNRFELEVLFMSVVAEENARTWHQWRTAYGVKLPIAVNIDPHVLSKDVDYSEGVVEMIEHMSIDHHYLEVELTENTLVSTDAVFYGHVHRLKQRGIRVAIDDFGMGHASLSYVLKDFFDVLKIDRMLIQGIDGDLHRQQIVKSIVALATSCGLEVVVEGTETAAEVATLKKLGVSIFQGYYFAKPLAEEAVMPFYLEVGGIDAE